LTHGSKDPKSLESPDFQKLLVSKRKLLGNLDTEKTIELLRSNGTTNLGTLGLMRRFLDGTPPSKLFGGQTKDVVREEVLTRINTELDKLFKIKGK